MQRRREKEGDAAGDGDGNKIMIRLRKRKMKWNVGLREGGDSESIQAEMEAVEVGTLLGECKMI